MNAVQQHAIPHANENIFTKAMNSFAQFAPMSHHQTRPGMGSRQLTKPEEPKGSLPTLTMNWRRHNAEEVNGIIDPTWENKQEPPPYFWSKADADFTLPSNATLQEPIHRLVRARPTSP
jgi:hypothetical protein